MVDDIYMKELALRNISWPRLGRAQEFYQRCGYTYIEVPWIVNRKYTNITYPLSHAFKTKGGDLVGSAEQGFLALSLCDRDPTDMFHDYRTTMDKSLRYPMLVACTPCFRDNQPDDDLHNPYFMKVELHLPTAPKEDVWHVVMTAAEFLRSEGAFPEFVKTEEGWDINVGGIEVGSYGFREHDGHSWIYGTGLAEPRFSQALRRQEKYTMDKLGGSVNYSELSR